MGGNRRDTMKRVTLWSTRLVVLAVLSVSIAQAQNEPRVALVIGNGAYRYAALQYPPREAEEMAVTLKECGFRVIKRINCGHQEMERAIRIFGQGIQQGGVGLFYYGGHGVQVKGRNYLIPVDADIQGEDEVKFKAVDAERVLGKMETAGNRVNIVILDACRNNPFGSRFKSKTRGLRKMDAPKGTLLAYSTAPGDIAVDGAYTPALIKHMKTPGLSILQVFMSVRDDVMKATGDSQVPWEATSLRADFYFVPPSSPPVVSPEQEPSPVTPPPTLVSEKRGRRKTWLWFLLGAAAAGGAGALVGGGGEETGDGPNTGVPTGDIIIEVPLPE